MLSEDGGFKAPIYSKPAHNNHLGGRYQNRQLYDNAYPEAEDLWQYSSEAGEGHSNARVKNTIAQLVATPYQTATQNLPNSTFKGGYMPHSYAGITSFNEYQEADTQPMRPDISPLEFAGMVQKGGTGVMPPDAKHDEAPDPFNIMVLRQKMRTSYALPQKAAVKFVDERTSRTFIDTLKQAPGRAASNRGITLTAQQEYVQTMKDAQQPTQLGRVLKNVSVEGLAKQLAGVFSADSFTEGAWKAGLVGMDAVRPDSDLSHMMANIQREGWVPKGILDSVMRYLYDETLKNAKP